MLVQAKDFSPAQLEQFRQLQYELYEILVDISKSLEVGESELDVTARIRKALKPLGVRSWFHIPVALFGDRTAYPGHFGQFEARPTDRTLQVDDAVILDAAPIIDGYLVDCSFGVPREGVNSDSFRESDLFLRELRDLIVRRANERANMRAIAFEVDDLIVERGFVNCHKKHIGQVLGHRASYTSIPLLAKRRIWGLSPIPVAWFFHKSRLASKGKPEETPNWNHTRQSDTPMQDGLWCVEPHIARGDLGLKFEELLLVDGDGARYLDNNLPHTNRWKSYPKP